MIWKKVKLGETATFVNGYPFKPSDWGKNGLPIIRIQNLTGSSNESNFFGGTIPEKYLVKNGDILISWSASLGVYEWNEGDAWLNQHIFKVIFDKVIIDKTFFKYLISLKIEEMLRATHGATMKHITKDKFDNIFIYLPTIETQRRIASILDKADSLRLLNKQLIAKYDELVQAVFYEIFGDPVRNEKGWKIVRLSALGSIDRGVSKNRPRNAPELLGGKYPLVQTGDISNSNGFVMSYNSTYSEKGLAQSKMWPKGTLCITIAANIAKTGILCFEACFPDSVVGYLPNNDSNVHFIQHWFSFFQKILEDKAPESAQKNINLEILRNLKTINPPIDLQSKFATIVESIESQKSHAQSALARSEELFEGLLDGCFKGEVLKMGGT